MENVWHYQQDSDLHRQSGVGYPSDRHDHGNRYLSDHPAPGPAGAAADSRPYRVHPAAATVEFLPQYLFDKGKIQTHQKALAARLENGLGAFAIFNMPATRSVGVNLKIDF